MMRQVEVKDTKKYYTLSDDRVEKITDYLSNLNYSPETLEKEVLIYIAQWLHDEDINIESTCLIISNIINIIRLEKDIQLIYDNVVNYPAKSRLSHFLTESEYSGLEEIIDSWRKDGTVEGELDDNTHIITNFNLKKVFHEKTTFRADGKSSSKMTPVIEAVPSKLIVYDSPLLDQPRTFKIIWESDVTNRKFVTSGESSGATIKEISSYLTDAGFSHNPKILEGALSCMINSLITTGNAEIKTDIDNPGFYYDINSDKITTVKKDISQPSSEELIRATNVLEELSKYFKENLDTLSTVFKWGCMAEFSYAIKQTGKWIPWMYLKGSAGSGKTTVAQIPLYTWNIPSPENNLGGSSVDTQARLGVKLSQSCDPIVVNEPVAVFSRKTTSDMIKVSIESTTSRSKYLNGKYRGFPAFSAFLFTANQYLPEDDSLLRRFYVISFSYGLRKTDHEKAMFEEKFHITTPNMSPLKIFNVFSRYVARKIIMNPGLLMDDWKEVIDNILNDLYSSIDKKIPGWLKEWAESESLDDFDNTQREDIRNFFNQQFNQARSRVKIVDEYGRNVGATLDVEEASDGDDFKDLMWEIVNNRMFDWAIPHVSGKSQKKSICFTQGLRKAISDKIDFCSDLKSIAELLGWDYKPVKIGGRSIRVIKVRLDDFMEFMYPNITFEGDE